MAPRISLVVPAHNEQELLPRLLDSVDEARASWSRGAAALEVVVADNASSDRTAEVARQRGCRVVRVEKRSIAAARNGGAAVARGDFLAFTDADGRIHRDTFDAIDRAMSSGRFVAGATGVRMERWSLGIGLTYLLALPVLWLTRFDTGVVFCARDDFEAIGGYDETFRYGEDLALLVALRRRGKATGRRLTRLRRVKCVASTRKFDRHGDWHYFTAMPALAWRLIVRRDTSSDFARRYWYDPDR